MMKKNIHNPKIYTLVGACASGKTTLFEKLQKINKDYSFAPEAARMFFEENKIPKKERYTFHTQVKIQDKCLKELEKAIKKRKSIIIADSSIIDPAAYAMLSEDQQMAKKLLDNVINQLSIYDLFLLLDIKDINYKHNSSDSLRTESEDQRSKVHNNLLKIIISLKLPYKIISGSVDERVKKIHQIIKNNQ